MRHPRECRNRGGFSLQLWSHECREHPYRPCIAVRNIGGRRSLISFTSVKDGVQRNRGRFLDLATLTFAHSDRKLSLETACGRFGVPYSKRLVAHGQITAEYVEYCREDVAATAALFRATMVEHNKHPIDLQPEWAMSAASIGKGYLNAMGIPPFAERRVQIDPQLAAYGMAAFYGGRAECRIRRVDTAVVYLDFMSMYPTCNALTHTSDQITAEHITPVDNTDDVAQLVNDPNLAQRLFDRELWPMLHTLVEIDPNGAILPVRARYTTTPSWGIGINPLWSERTCWFALGDVLAAVLLGGPAPIIKQAVRLTPSADKLANLRCVDLRGQVRIDPAHEDLFATVVEQRHRVRNDPNLDSEERKRLEDFLKVLANSTGYGIFAECHPARESGPIEVTVHCASDSFLISTDTPEDPGPYTNPAIAACITATARLMLALLEHEITRHGGSYVFCDTDSMAIVATPGGGTIDIAGEAVTAISWSTIREVVDSFLSLNPYDRDVIPESILKIEKENYDGDEGRQRELFCYAISAKRYQLTTTNGDHVKVSEHGLGHLINPRTDGKKWFREAWQWLCDPSDEPEWLDLPALSQLTITSPDTWRWFDRINHGLPYADRVKPANFILVAYPDPLDFGDAQPVTAHHRDPHDWRSWEWIDRRTGEPIRIHTHPRDGYRRSSVRILTYRDILTRHHQHPEHKSLGPDHQPCRGDTCGLLPRRPVHAVDPITYLGKEADGLDNLIHGITDVADAVNEYAPPDHEWHTLIVPALATLPTVDVAAATGVHRRTIQRALSNKATIPREQDRTKLNDFIVRYARSLINARRTDSDQAVLYRYLQQR